MPAWTGPMPSAPLPRGHRNHYRRELAELDRQRALTLSRILGDLSAAASTIRHALDLIAARGAR